MKNLFKLILFIFLMIIAFKVGGSIIENSNRNFGIFFIIIMFLSAFFIFKEKD